MLQRILEPEVMDSPQDADEYNDMDHSEVNHRFVQELLAFAEANADPDYEFELGDVLDMGTGTALIPIELCKQHDSCRVMAIDQAVSMLDLAVYNLEVQSLTERITLAHVDAKTMGYDDGNFDVVMSNSLIHHIPDPIVCLKQMARVTKSGGLLFIRDLMRPNDMESMKQLVSTYAGAESEHCQKLFEDSLHAALSLDEIRQRVAELGFAHATVQATSDRHWTWSAVKS